MTIWIYFLKTKFCLKVFLNLKQNHISFAYLSKC